jgi:hypothetical protein
MGKVTTDATEAEILPRLKTMLSIFFFIQNAISFFGNNAQLHARTSKILSVRRGDKF